MGSTDTHSCEKLPYVDVFSGIDAARENVRQRRFKSGKQNFKSSIPIERSAGSCLLEKHGTAEDKCQHGHTNSGSNNKIDIQLCGDQIQDTVNNIQASIVEVLHQRWHDSRDKKFDLLSHSCVDRGHLAWRDSSALDNIQLVEVVDDHGQDSGPLFKRKVREETWDSPLTLGAGQESDERMGNNDSDLFVDL
ncbi:hypothetical protein HG530_010048 [Fusarium avenaceum]|nr:hypothetical protein HG530_010048 [Fusarium avenaceum]